MAEVLAKQKDEVGEVVDALADGQAVGKPKAGEDDDSLKTPIKPKNSKTVTIASAKKERPDQDTLPIFEKLVKEEMEKRLVEDAKNKESKTVKNPQFPDDEDEYIRQYEDSVAKMKQASERIKKIKAEKEERFKMQIEEQRKEERQRRERDDEEKRQMLRWVSDQRQEAIKSQKEKNISRIMEEQLQHKQKLMELESEVEQERQRKTKTERKESHEVFSSKELYREEVTPVRITQTECRS